MLAYLVSAIGFIQTRLYWPYQFHGNTNLHKNIIQDSPPDWITNFPKVYK
jgi:hypothetical protein